jgi:hypothetical protein
MTLDESGTASATVASWPGRSGNENQVERPCGLLGLARSPTWSACDLKQLCILGISQDQSNFASTSVSGSAFAHSFVHRALAEFRTDASDRSGSPSSPGLSF